MKDAKTRLVVIDIDDLTDIVATAVTAAVADALRNHPVDAKAKLLDRRGLAKTLNISSAALDRLRAQAGFPEIRIGDAPRFEVDRVLAWLRNREVTT